MGDLTIKVPTWRRWDRRNSLQDLPPVQPLFVTERTKRPAVVSWMTLKTPLAHAVGNPLNRGSRPLQNGHFAIAFLLFYLAATSNIWRNALSASNLTAAL